MFAGRILAREARLEESKAKGKVQKAKGKMAEA
jgi:hypothetical protein